VRDALALLERTRPDAGLLRAFELHLLRVTGYEPALDRCQRCGAALATVPCMYVHPLRGGVRCPRCRGEGRAYVVSRPTLEHLIALQRAVFGGADAERFTLPAGMAAEARALVRSFFAGSLTEPLVSERLLEGL
jgi:DNA repair protein RecO (recombination protein O)